MAQFLEELKEADHGIQGVPLREGWFVAFGGEPSIFVYSSPPACQLPRWIRPAVQRFEKPYWNWLYFRAYLRRQREQKLSKYPGVRGTN